MIRARKSAVDRQGKGGGYVSGLTERTALYVLSYEIDV